VEQRKMLSDEQWNELYTSSIETRKDVAWILKGMDQHSNEIEDCRGRIQEIEIARSFARGKVAFLAVAVTALCTILVNACLWAFTHYGGAE
jgi:hypothetical protein